MGRHSQSKPRQQGTALGLGRGAVRECRPVPKPTFKKGVTGGAFTAKVKKEIWLRAGGLCEGPDCLDRTGGIWGLHTAHRYQEGKPHRGMGGTKRQPTADDGALLCLVCHFGIDHKQKMVVG